MHETDGSLRGVVSSGKKDHGTESPRMWLSIAAQEPNYMRLVDKFER